MVQMLAYLLMGGALYVLGTVIFLKKIKPNKHSKERLKFTDKRLLPYIVACFFVMLILSAVISLFLLKHPSLDVAYVLVNSVVGVFVFAFGLNPDEYNMRLPD